MEKQLLILSSTFPVDSNDVFLEKELPFLKVQFRNILIVPTDVEHEAFSSYTEDGVQFEIRTFPCTFSAYCRSVFSKQFLHVVREIILLNKQKRLTLFKLKVLLKAHCKAVQIAQFTNKLLNSSLPTVGYSYWGDTSAVALGYLKRIKPQIETVARFHGWDLYEERALEAYLPLRTATWRSLDFLVPISQHGVDYLKAKDGAGSPHNFRLAYLGVSKAKKFPEYTVDSCVQLISVINTSEVKRLDRLISVVNYLNTRINLKWTLVGIPHENLELLCSRMHVRPIGNCYCPGVLSNEEVIRLYEEKSFDALLSLSDSEGVPFSMMEAMVHETPVLSTDVGGVSELVQQDRGLLFSVHDTDDSIATSIYNWLQRPLEDRISERKQARIFVEKHFLDETNFGNFASWLTSLKSSFPDEPAS